MDAGSLSVRQSLEQTNAGLKFKQPKTQKSRRVVALPPLTVEALRRHKAEQAKERLLFGPAYKDHGLVCARMHGTFIGPNEITAAFAALIRETVLPKVRFHDLRHTHATQLLRQGIHPKVVSERLGHSARYVPADESSVAGVRPFAAR